MVRPLGNMSRFDLGIFSFELHDQEIQSRHAVCRWTRAWRSWDFVLSLARGLAGEILSPLCAQHRRSRPACHEFQHPFGTAKVIPPGRILGIADWISHINSETPGAIHEGGELGYALSVSFGAVMDKPDLIVACIIGDGEAETGPTATLVA